MKRACANRYGQRNGRRQPGSVPTVERTRSRVTQAEAVLHAAKEASLRLGTWKESWSSKLLEAERECRPWAGSGGRHLMSDQCPSWRPSTMRSGSDSRWPRAQRWQCISVAARPGYRRSPASVESYSPVRRGGVPQASRNATGPVPPVPSTPLAPLHRICTSPPSWRRCRAAARGTARRA